MLALVCLFITLASLYIGVRPLILYFRDKKGFRKYPTQNFLSGITGLAYGWEVARKHTHFHSKRLHDASKNKPVVRVAPNWLSFQNSRAVKDIYGYNSSCSKGGVYTALQGKGKHLVNIVDRSEHAHRRRMVAVAYAPKNIDLWEPDVANSVARLLKHMDDQCTAPCSSTERVPAKEDLNFDLVHWSFLYTMENVVKIGLSKDLHFTDTGSDGYPLRHENGEVKNTSFLKSLHGGSRAAATLVWDTGSFPMLKKATHALLPGYKENWTDSENWGSIVTQLVKERIERHRNGETLNDLFQPMLEDKSGRTPEIDDDNRIAEVDQMINGGTDGAAVSVASTIYYLLKNPEKMKILRKELDSALSPSEDIAPWSKVRHVNYLRACIDESMRLSPPVATDLVRRTPPEGARIDDQMVPGNTWVSISAYTAHRDPSVFTEPEAYVPERWLAKGDDRLKEMLTRFIPFSAGSRSCIGRNVSMLEQQVLVATLCYRYEFALPAPDWEMEWEEYFNLWPLKLPLKIWRRYLKAASA